MKKSILSMTAKGVIVGLVCASLPLLASATSMPRHFESNVQASHMPRGFSDMPAAVITIADLKDSAQDKMRVTLRGALTEYLGKDRFLFADHTGSVEVELDDDKDWSFISKGEYIQIEGEVDKDFMDLKVEVERALSLEH